MHLSPVACAVLSFIPVKADRNLIKDVLTCRPLVESIYKSRHADDTDDPDAVSLSSEDEAEDLGEVLGVSRRLPKPAPSSSPRQHEPESHEAGPDNCQIAFVNPISMELLLDNTSATPSPSSFLYL